MQKHHFRWPETRLSDNEQYNDIFMEYHIPKGFVVVYNSTISYRLL